MCTKTKALGITLLCGRTSEYHDQGSLYAYKDIYSGYLTCLWQLKFLTSGNSFRESNSKMNV